MRPYLYDQCTAAIRDVDDRVDDRAAARAVAAAVIAELRERPTRICLVRYDDECWMEYEVDSRCVSWWVDRRLVKQPDDGDLPSAVAWSAPFANDDLAPQIADACRALDAAETALNAAVDALNSALNDATCDRRGVVIVVGDRCWVDDGGGHWTCRDYIHLRHPEAGR